MPHPNKVLSEMTAEEEEELPSVNHQESAEQIDIALGMLSGKVNLT